MSSAAIIISAPPTREGRAAERFIYAALWPLYCHYCEGAGWHLVTVGDEDCCEVEADTCPFCVAQDRCPRCTAVLTRLACPCGWDANDASTAMPAEILDWGATEFHDADFVDPFSEEGE